MVLRKNALCHPGACHRRGYAVVKEMLTLTVRNNHPLRGMTNFINSHTVPIMQVFVAVACQWHCMLRHHAGSFSQDPACSRLRMQPDFAKEHIFARAKSEVKKDRLRRLPHESVPSSAPSWREAPESKDLAYDVSPSPDSRQLVVGLARAS